MKKERRKKAYILGAMAAVTVIISIIILSTNKESHPFEPIIQLRDYVTDYQTISTEKNEDGIMVYSIGKVNDGNDDMYFVDMVKKSLIGYKWTGGGGHIDRSTLNEGKKFLLSVQLLNENQNITPTLFGVIADERIDKVLVRTRKGVKNSIVYDVKEQSEKLYVVHFERNVSDEPYFIVIITYKDGSEAKHVISGNNITRLQEGRQTYLYEEQFN